MLNCAFFFFFFFFVCSLDNFLLDNFLLKNFIVFFFWKSNFKMALIRKKKVIFDLLFSLFFSHHGRHKFLQHISHIHARILLTLLTFLALQILQKSYKFIMYGFSLVCDSWCLFLFAPFWSNQ